MKIFMKTISDIQNNVGFQSISLGDIARTVGLPADKTMASLAQWVRDHWKG